MTKELISILLTIYFMSSISKVFGVEKVVFTNFSDLKEIPWFCMYNPKYIVDKNPTLLKEHTFLSEAKFILCLSESFSQTPNNISYPVSDVIEAFTPQDCCIFKTSIDCPEEQHNNTNGKITSLKIDNKKIKMPFENNQFDIIIMRKGLCLCSSPIEGCGGIKYEVDFLKEFFHEILRILNKKKVNSSIFLDGRFDSRIKDNVHTNTLDDMRNEEMLWKVLNDVSEYYKGVTFEMIYTQFSISYAINHLKIDYNLIKDDNGKLLKDQYSVDQILDHNILMFQGLRITCKELEIET